MIDKDLLFQNKEVIGMNIASLIEEEGYTKSSFSKKTDISRPTLNKIIEGEINSITTFEKHLSKILDVLNINFNRLLDLNLYQDTVAVTSVYSDNAPVDYERSVQVKDSLNTLECILDLCEIYL